MSLLARSKTTTFSRVARASSTHSWHFDSVKKQQGLSWSHTQDGLTSKKPTSPWIPHWDNLTPAMSMKNNATLFLWGAASIGIIMSSLAQNPMIMNYLPTLFRNALVTVLVLSACNVWVFSTGGLLRSATDISWGWVRQQAVVPNIRGVSRKLRGGRKPLSSKA